MKELTNSEKIMLIYLYVDVLQERKESEKYNTNTVEYKLHKHSAYMLHRVLRLYINTIYDSKKDKEIAGELLHFCLEQKETAITFITSLIEDKGA